MGQLLSLEDYITLEFYEEGVTTSILELEIPFWSVKIVNKTIHNYFLLNGFNIDYSNGLMHLQKKNINYFIQIIPTI